VDRPTWKPPPYDAPRSRQSRYMSGAERHSTGFKLTNQGVDTRSLQHYLGTRTSNIRFDIANFLPSGSAISGRTRTRSHGGPHCLGDEGVFSGARRLRFLAGSLAQRAPSKRPAIICMSLQIQL
jgi:hypothetical protein